MNSSACESYEVHISALMDGEASPADVLTVLDHLPGCASCQRFYRDARELQELVDALPVTPGSTLTTEQQAHGLGKALLLQGEAEAMPSGSVESAETHSERVVPIGAGEERVAARNPERAPRWVWALAASLLLALGFGLGDRVGGLGAPSAIGSGGEVHVEIGADAGRMSEERFVALAVELLRADRRYRDKMGEVLEAVEDRRAREGYDGELADWRDESSASTRTEEGGAGMGEVLRLSPMRGVY